ncbi:MAG: Ppx/GppA family phosphatase [Deltaproteobacteria bacterium]|nr:Ppx/GppA family phosphatase [Deltaproteobacteria bacterium]
MQLQRPAERDTEAQTPRLVAAIDIGSNSLRLAIAEVGADGRIEIVDQLQRAVHLGQDTFGRGRLGRGTMRAAIAILRDFHKSLEFYGVTQVRAVATSAVREAANADTFLNRVYLATGLDAEVIDTTEESRLIVQAVRRALGAEYRKKSGNALVADVGGGSTLLTLLLNGEITLSQSLVLGAIRIQETFLPAAETPLRRAAVVRQQVHTAIHSVEAQLRLKQIRTLVAVGAGARFAAQQAGKATPESDLATISRTRFAALVRRFERYSAEELARHHGLSFSDAEMLNPSLLVFEALLKATRAKEIIVPPVAMRDGVLLDLARSAGSADDPAIIEGVVHSALSVARKYNVDLAHAQHVSGLAVRLFDALQGEHRLTARERLLLQVAGLVHEVGGFVSSRAHHKHSYYLIANAEIFGLTREEIHVVAHVARYHRRSPPKSSHLEYMALPRPARMLVSKLAAMLRVADALDRAHAQQVTDLRVQKQDDDLTLYIRGAVDLTLERAAVVGKGDMFEDIYGMRLRLEDEPLPPAAPPRP